MKFNFPNASRTAQNALAGHVFKSFMTNSPVAEEALSGSTDVGLFVSKAWYSFAKLFDLFFVVSKNSFPLSQIVIGSLLVLG